MLEDFLDSARRHHRSNIETRNHEETAVLNELAKTRLATRASEVESTTCRVEAATVQANLPAAEGWTRAREVNR